MIYGCKEKKGEIKEGKIFPQLYSCTFGKGNRSEGKSQGGSGRKRGGVYILDLENEMSFV